MRKRPNLYHSVKKGELYTAVVMIGVIAAVSISSAVIIGIGDDDTAGNEKSDLSFGLKAEPMKRDIELGENATYEISLVDTSFEKVVNLDVLDCYDGVISSLDPCSISGNEIAVLSLEPMFPGEFERIIEGTYGGYKDTITVELIVEENGGPDDDDDGNGDDTGDDDVPDKGWFQLLASPLSRIVKAGENTTYEIFLKSSPGFNGTVELEVMDCYDGVLSSMDTYSIGPGDTATLTLHPICPGTFERTINGICGMKRSSIAVALVAE